MSEPPGDEVLAELRQWNERADVAARDDGPLYVDHRELDELRRLVCRDELDRLGYLPPANLHVGALAGFVGIPVVVDEERARARRHIEELARRRRAEVLESLAEALGQPGQPARITHIGPA